MSRLVEGYVLNSYGAVRYLHHAVASALTIRRHDPYRPIAIYCSKKHQAELERYGIDALFEVVEVLPDANQSLTGFKHHLHRFMPFDRNLYADSDIVWCRDPEPLWQQFAAHGFTITGNERADFWFGGPKSVQVIFDIILNRRGRTLKRFGLTHLPRVQSGLMFAQDRELTRRVCERAAWFLDHRHLTHFRSRLDEYGRSLESCEWSLAMAMSEMDIPVTPWLQAHNSPQLDFIEPMTSFDPDFEHVSCYYPCDRFVYSFRGFPIEGIRKFLMGLVSKFPGKGDYLYVTPFALHFGWIHHKQPFYEFSERTWERLARREAVGVA
ncbi:MAG: hypothetical protein AAGI08_15430 [Bacteroidota bacterium]